MSDCSEISLLLGPFEDGELEPHEMQEVARHLANCNSCEKILNEYSLLGRELRGILTVPALDGFAEAVNARIEDLGVPWHERVGRWLGGVNERFAAVLAMGSLAAGIAVLTAILVTPYMQHRLGGGTSATLAKIQKDAVSRVSSGSQAAGDVDEAGLPTHQVASLPSDVSNFGSDSHAVISRLEAEMPSVAVWSEPQNDTTVIWLPEQQQ